MKAVANLAEMAVNGLQMCIEHKDEKVFFSMAMFKKAYFAQDKDTFDHINAYWASLPMDQQDQIFSIYVSIGEYFDSFLPNGLLKDKLLVKVPELLNMHNLEAIERWVRYDSDIQIPASFNETYVANVDKNTTPDKTYTRGEYISLVSLSIALRVLVPVWGAYIKAIRTEAGNDFKEQIAFSLILQSAIYNSPAMSKLYQYIEAQIAKSEFNPHNTINFISREDYPFWLLSLVCVKRLCIGDIRSKEPNANLVSLVYNTIIQRSMYGETDFNNMIRAKKADEYGLDGESKISNLERFKTVASISLGQITEMEHSMRDIFASSLKICPHLDLAVLERSLQTSQILRKDEIKIMDPQWTLMRWIFAPVISPRGIPYLPLEITLQCLGATEAILWTMGHRYLSLIVTAYAIIEDGVHRVSVAPSKMRTVEDLTEQLDKYFPYKRLVPGKNGGPMVEHQPVSDAINHLATEISRYSWRATADESILDPQYCSTSRRIPAIPDLKNEITKLVIDLAKTPK